MLRFFVFTESFKYFSTSPSPAAFGDQRWQANQSYTCIAAITRRGMGCSGLGTFFWYILYLFFQVQGRVSVDIRLGDQRTITQELVCIKWLKLEPENWTAIIKTRLSNAAIWFCGCLRDVKDSCSGSLSLSLSFFLFD